MMGAWEKGGLMDASLKENIKASATWQRGLFMLLFVVCYGVAEVVLTLVVVLQFLFVLFTRQTNGRLLGLGQQLAAYIYQILRYLTFNSETRPYPFSDWPGQRDAAAGDTQEDPASDGD